jgi:predicted transposase YbfD/YdcC
MSLSPSCWTCWPSKGRSITIDAMGCPRGIAQEVVEKKAD